MNRLDLLMGLQPGSSALQMQAIRGIPESSNIPSDKKPLDVLRRVSPRPSQGAFVEVVRALVDGAYVVTHSDMSKTVLPDGRGLFRRLQSTSS